MRRATAITALATLGVAVGLGLYTFVYAKGWSYLTNDPKACANCHVMNEQYDGWLKGSHRSVAVCNDCHVPHNLVGKYYTKARNGFWHSFYFTTQTFHEPIRATPGSRRVTEAACRTATPPSSRRWALRPTRERRTSRASAATAPWGTWSFPRRPSGPT